MTTKNTPAGKESHNLLKIGLAIAILSLPFLIPPIYRSVITPNPRVRIAGGYQGGRYDEFAQALAEELNRSSLLNQAESVRTEGSYDNLRLLESRQVDFALFQAGSDLPEDLIDEHRDVVFVSNVFPEVAHLVVRSDIPETRIEKFSFSRIAVGIEASGDYRVGMAMVDFYQLDQNQTRILTLDYEEMIEAFRNSEIELAIINVGVGAKVIHTMIEELDCRLIELPLRDAFLGRHVGYVKYTIPRGNYFLRSHAVPDRDLKTIAVNAQLLTHRSVPSGSVQEILRVLNRSRFLKQNHLRDLYIQGKEYALQQPEYPMHPGVTRFYNPSFRPLINPDFVEATEGLRSFVVSGLIGLFLLIRWIRKRNERAQAHKLDQYIHRLLEIEMEQMQLDRDFSRKQAEQLEGYLDEITLLRREALQEFTAHELNDDPAIECFISMSHALSEKIGSKLTRDEIRKTGSPPGPASGSPSS